MVHIFTLENIFHLLTPSFMNSLTAADKNLKLETDNLEMGQRFKTILSQVWVVNWWGSSFSSSLFFLLLGQYEEREKQMDRINKQMEVILLNPILMSCTYQNSLM